MKELGAEFDWVLVTLMQLSEQKTFKTKSMFHYEIILNI